MYQKVVDNTSFIIRIILSLSFLGHGLVSLGFSPSYSLHYNLIESINITAFSSKIIVELQGWFDIIISLLLMINFKLKKILYIVIFYLFIVCIAAVCFYWDKTNSIFGITECIRRLPWILLSIFLIKDLAGEKKYQFIRISLALAFIAHGLASLGFLGLKQGHIDLAIKVVSKEDANLFVYLSGITDSIIGIMLLQGIYTKFISIISILWISFIVYISFLNAFPDGIFRLGFLILAIYIYIDERTYYPKFVKL
tara:strand:- start:14068 stop:14826 length:759 start_codon:yes stop_codon:yes gene_type:complete